MLAVPVFQWRASCCLVLGGWDGDNSLATSDYVCSSMEMHPSQYDQQTPPSPPYLVLITGHHHLHIMYFLQSLPPLTFEAEAVFGCATFNSPMHDNREVVLAVGGMRTKATAQVLDYSQPNPAWTTSNYYSFIYCFIWLFCTIAGITTFCLKTMLSFILLSDWCIIWFVN